MGCFTLTVLKSKKKRPDQASYSKRIEHMEQSPSKLPEPQSDGRSLQSAPPSFRNRAKPVQPAKRITNSRARAMSAPSSLSAAEQDALASMECEDEEELKSWVGSMKEHRVPSPQPLPLPSPQDAVVLRNLGSFKSGSATNSGPLHTFGSLPLPPVGTLRYFSYEEILSACNNFSPDQCMSEGHSSMIFKASFGDDSSGSRKLDASVNRIHSSTQGIKDFVNLVNTLASLQHPCICKLLGYHAREGSENRMLVYERLYHGSLDRLLYGRPDGPPIDWSARMKVALCAAQGLTFLHEEGPFQAMYNAFSTVNIQIDKDYSARLSGYGCVSHIPETEISNNSPALANISAESQERGLLTPKSNVWSFGIILLELLTGRRNFDSRHQKEERNLVNWSRPYLADDGRLTLIMDPQLKGRFPAKAAQAVADIVQKCLHKDPSERPTMRTIVEQLKVIQEMKQSSRFPLQEPEKVAQKHMSKSFSLNGIVPPAPRSGVAPSLSSKPMLSASFTRLSTVLPASLPPRACSSTLSLVELEQQESRRSSSSTGRRTSVEGF